LTAHLRQARTVLRRTNEIEAIYIELDRLIERHGLPERTIDALFDAAAGLRVRRSVYRAILEGQSEDSVSEQTATRDLQALTNAGLLVPHGEKRGRFYTAGPEIVNIRNRVVGKRDRRDDTDPFSIGATAEPGQTRLFEVN
jgi:DNA-binding transcriptional ArsR family regulator